MIDFSSVNIIKSSVCHLFSFRFLGSSITDFQQLHGDHNSCLVLLDTGPGVRKFLGQSGSYIDRIE